LVFVEGWNVVALAFSPVKGNARGGTIGGEIASEVARGKVVGGKVVRGKVIGGKRRLSWVGVI
jgi:hypothetical protein